MASRAVNGERCQREVNFVGCLAAWKSQQVHALNVATITAMSTYVYICIQSRMRSKPSRKGKMKASADRTSDSTSEDVLRR
jgi:hypothetical protein